MHIKASFCSYVISFFLVIIFGSGQNSFFSYSQIVQRDDTSVCGPEIYCLPKRNETWTMSTVGVIRWYPKYPTFVVQDRVDVRLYDVTDLRKPVLERLNTTNGDGYMYLELDPNLQPPIFAPVLNRPKNYTAQRIFCFSITPAGDTTVGNLNGPYFYIQDPPPLNESTLTTSTTLSTVIPTYTTMTSQPESSTPISTNTPNQVNSKRKPESVGLSSGAIAGISVGSIAVLVAAGIALMFYRKRSKKSQFDTGTGKNSSQDDSTGGAITENVGVKRLNSLRLTANDARLIAETYRRLLRKPSWGLTDEHEIIPMRTGSSPISSTHSINPTPDTTPPGKSSHLPDHL
ncbi:hypothetical protein K7432_000156 [Basidiobolus ranarum]|uniref:Mid2 domain-containing protein n=1 Tax=Basidiobolus ranarum TaxID=34480 RepID=A0ABR2WBN9_9FUNG